MEPQTALLIAVSAAVVGQLLGAALTIVGGFVNDYFASKREERQQAREDRRQVEQREHEDHIREAQRGHQEKRRSYENRIRAYQRFMEASTLDVPLDHYRIPEYRLALNTSYIESMFHTSEWATMEVQTLYRAATEVLDLAQEEAVTDQQQSEAWDKLGRARTEFIEAVRYELERGL